MLDKQKTQHPSHPLSQTHQAYFNTPRLKKLLFCNNGRYTTNIPTDPHTVTTTDIMNIACTIYTHSIVSRHLATRGNNKILRTPPHTLASLKRYFPASLVAPLPSSEQTNLPSSNFRYLHCKSTPKHIHLPLCPLVVTSTHT